VPSASVIFAGTVPGGIDPNYLDPQIEQVRKMSDCKKRLHYKMPHKTSEGETFTINYHFDQSFPDARYEAWEVAREASLQCVSFESGMKKRLLSVMRKVDCDDQLRLRVRRLCDDALLR